MHARKQSNFDNRTLVFLPSPDHIVKNAENEDESGNGRGPVHRSCVRIYHTGPEAKEKDDNEVNAADSVVDDAKRTW